MIKYLFEETNSSHIIDQNIIFCYEILGETSRSFSLVIKQLRQDVRLVICIFYLVLRGLDTIEDDPTLLPLERKVKLMRLFLENVESSTTNQHQAGFLGIGQHPHELKLMENFDRVFHVFHHHIDPVYQKIIVEIANEMGKGMIEFLNNSPLQLSSSSTATTSSDTKITIINHQSTTQNTLIAQRCHSLDDFNRYCYYVAGLVGVGLTQIFLNCGESQLSHIDASVSSSYDAGSTHQTFQLQPVTHRLAVSMGLFLQCVNIIRDFQEDIESTRLWWPQEIVKHYTHDPLTFLKEKPTHVDAAALHCLNHMIIEALNHCVNCIEYMRHLKRSDVFRFCAIPQVMAFATLVECYNNPLVFTRNARVKISRSKTLTIVLSTNTIFDVCQQYNTLVDQIKARIPPAEPNAAKLLYLLRKIKTTTSLAISKCHQQQQLSTDSLMKRVCKQILLFWVRKTTTQKRIFQLLIVALIVILLVIRKRRKNTFKKLNYSKKIKD